MSQRLFHRVTFSAPGELIHHELTYRGRVENLSLRGALVSADECIMVPLGDTCTMSLCPSQEDPPIVLTVKVMHSFFSMVGVSFVDFPEDTERRLFELMKTITSEPDQLRLEWEEILAHSPDQQEK